MNREPIVSIRGEAIAANGPTLCLHEWSHGPNDGPLLHVHHSDDEAWYVLEGTLRFRFAGRNFDATPGTCVFASAGVAHTYGNPGPGNAKYLIMMTPKILELIGGLHSLENPTADETAAVYRKYDSEILE